MSDAIIDESNLTGIANAIRSKNGSANTYTPAGMIDAINALTTSTPNLQAKTVTPTGSQQVVTPSSGYVGLSKVTVAAAALTQKSVTPTTTLRTVTPGSGYYGLSQVVVGAIPSQYIVPSGTVTITSNGIEDVTDFETAVINVPNQSTGTITITDNGDYNVSSYANAYVNVSGGGVTPTGTITITSNGIKDVTNFASASVDVHDFENYAIINTTAGTCSMAFTDVCDALGHGESVCAIINNLYVTSCVYCNSPQNYDMVYFFYDISTDDSQGFDGSITCKVTMLDDADELTTWTLSYTDGDNVAY